MLINDVVNIRIADSSDSEPIADIYKPYVENTAVSFEYIPPDEEEFKRRITNTLLSYPYLVAEYKGQVVGYAYASPFLPRAAYCHSVELSIYINDEYRCIGIGRCLYTAMEDLLRLQNVFNLNACIAYTDEEDITLTNASTAFHSKMGYSRVGRFTAVGYKFERLYDIIWMQKLTEAPTPPLAPFVPFKDICPRARQLLTKKLWLY